MALPTARHQGGSRRRVGELRRSFADQTGQGAARECIAPASSAEAPTTDGIIATLKTLDRKGRRVGVHSIRKSECTMLDSLAAAGARRMHRAVSLRLRFRDRCGRRSDPYFGGRGVDFIAFTSNTEIAGCEGS